MITTATTTPAATAVVLTPPPPDCESEEAEDDVVAAFVTTSVLPGDVWVTTEGEATVAVAVFVEEGEALELSLPTVPMPVV